VVQEHLENFLAEGAARSEHGFGYPAYIKAEFEAFLRCGLLQAGFARLICESCEREHRGTAPALTLRDSTIRLPIRRPWEGDTALNRTKPPL
jgi:hypothetical protein